MATRKIVFSKTVLRHTRVSVAISDEYFMSISLSKICIFFRFSKKANKNNLDQNLIRLIFLEIRPVSARWEGDKERDARMWRWRVNWLYGKVGKFVVFLCWLQFCCQKTLNWMQAFKNLGPNCLQKYDIVNSRSEVSNPQNEVQCILVCHILYVK